MNDLIKREDAVKYCKSKAEHYRKRLARIEAQGDAIGYDPTEQIKGFKDEIAIYESFVKELEEIPAVEPKRGTYRDSGEDDEWYGHWAICNECGAEWMGDENFCPNCGARMKRADDE